MHVQLLRLQDRLLRLVIRLEAIQDLAQVKIQGWAPWMATEAGNKAQHQSHLEVGASRLSVGGTHLVAAKGEQGAAAYTELDCCHGRLGVGPARARNQ